VKTDSLSKTQLILRTRWFFGCYLREIYVKTKTNLFVMKQTM